jgi:HPt (histidine-containing phosphotransfer) domain-containing protein
MKGKMREACRGFGHQLLTSTASGCGLGCGVTGCGAVIDWKRVEELREEIGADGFVEVADMFLDEAAGAVRALLTGLPAGEVEGQLHFLKGSALNLGLADLAAICQEGERKVSGGQMFDMAQVEAVWQTSRAGLLGGLSKQAGAA